MPERPVPSSTGVSGRMQRQRRKDTEPELALRGELHRAGLRYRIGLPVVGSPRRTIDIAFTRAHVAVYIDGCFWHGCPLHGTIPRSNSAWWENKLEANRARDASVNEQLHELGWTVLRFWEHEAPDAVVEQVYSVVRAPAM